MEIAMKYYEQIIPGMLICSHPDFNSINRLFNKTISIYDDNSIVWRGKSFESRLDIGICIASRKVNNGNVVYVLSPPNIGWDIAQYYIPIKETNT